MYYGWAVVACSGLVYALIMGTTFSAFGLFVIPVSQDLKLSRAEMNTALILLNIGSAAMAPFIGRMLDKVPARRVMIVSALLFGFSFAVLSVSTSLWLNAAVLVFALSAAVQGGGTLTVTVLLARWFTARRGRAMILAAMGMSFGGIAIVPALGWLIANEGWRTSLLVMSGATTITLITIALILRERPQPGELEGSQPVQPSNGQIGGAVSAPPEKVLVLLQMPQFWTIAMSTSIAMAVGQAIIVTIVPLGIDTGLTMVQAAGLVSLSGGAAIAAKLLLSILADRFDRIYMLAVMYALGIGVSLVLATADTYLVLMACAVMLGIASSAMSPILYALLADRFGITSFGTVRGLMALPIALLGAVAVRGAGEIYDRTGSYTLMFHICMLLGLLAVVLMLLTRLTAPMVPALEPLPT